MSDTIKNISTSSIQSVIDAKKQKKSDDSKNEIKSIKIAREASGDNPQTSSISTSIDSSKTAINQEIEKAEKALEVNLPATNIANNSKTDEKQKKEAEEINQKIEANNLNIIANWSNLGGKEGAN